MNMDISLKNTFLIIALGISLSLGAFEPIGYGGLVTEQPANTQGPINALGQKAIPKVSRTFNQPIITNKWWSSLLWPYNKIQNQNTLNMWSEQMVAHPLTFQVRTDGLEMIYSTFVAINNEYHYQAGGSTDMKVGTENLQSNATYVKSYSDWVVTMEWPNALEATIGHGLPFVYFFKKTFSDLVLNYNNQPTVWYNRDGVLGISVNNHHYGIFAPNGSSWKIQNKIFTSNLSGKNFCSIAILPDNTQQTLEFFKRYAYAFVTDSQVSWNYDEDQSMLYATYSVTTNLMEKGENNLNQTILALYRHQWMYADKTPFTAYTYVSPRGLMKVIAQNQFTTATHFNGFIPMVPLVAKQGENGYDQEILYNYIDSVYKQSYVERWRFPLDQGDTYWAGKSLGKIAQLALLAHAINYQEARNLFLSELKEKLEYWFSGKNKTAFYYDKTWNTIIGYPASYGSNTELNDHHFHWGYFIMASAVLAMFEPDWASLSKWGGMVQQLIKDVNNPDRTDTKYAFLKFFDIYAGHALANGPELFGKNNQESSSESMNFSSGVLLFGAATGNKKLRDLGIFLYSTEATAVRQYWFDVDKQVFPKDFKFPVVGMVWDDGAAYATWFDANPTMIHAINFLPITAGSLYLGTHPDYLKINLSFMEERLKTMIANEPNENRRNQLANAWQGIIMSTRALADPKEAIAQFNKNQNYWIEEGESRAFTYAWIHNLAQLGFVDTSVTADIPTALVFVKNGIKTYVVYNPDTLLKTVKFSTGIRISVPAHSLLAVQSNGALKKLFETSFVLPSAIELPKNKAIQTEPGIVIKKQEPTGPKKIIKQGVDNFDRTYEIWQQGDAVTITITEHANAQPVILHYTLQDAHMINVGMQKDEGTKWSYTIHDIRASDSISFYITDNKIGDVAKEFSVEVKLP